MFDSAACIEVLRSCGADINIKINDNKTALELASKDETRTLFDEFKLSGSLSTVSIPEHDTIDTPQDLTSDNQYDVTGHHEDLTN